MKNPADRVVLCQLEACIRCQSGSANLPVANLIVSIQKRITAEARRSRSWKKCELRNSDFEILLSGLSVSV